MPRTLDARDPAALSVLAPWFGRGQTLALVGSSGVGKSTIVNALQGNFGRSFVFNMPVLDLILSRLPASPFTILRST